MEELQSGAQEQSGPDVQRSYLYNRIKAEAKKLIVEKKGERLNPDSFDVIENYVEKKADELGLELTNENVEKLIAMKDIQDAIINATIVRLSTDTTKQNAYLIDSRGEVIAPVENLGQAEKITKEERQK